MGRWGYRAGKIGVNREDVFWLLPKYRQGGLSVSSGMLCLPAGSSQDLVRMWELVCQVPYRFSIAGVREVAMDSLRRLSFMGLIP